MEKLSGVFVHNPIGIILVAGLFFVAYFLLRYSKSFTHSKALLVPGVVWTLWAIWEFVVTRNSPQANIRVDLLLIIPLALIASAYEIIKLFLSRKTS